MVISEPGFKTPRCTRTHWKICGERWKDLLHFQRGLSHLRPVVELSSHNNDSGEGQSSCGNTYGAILLVEMGLCKNKAFTPTAHSDEAPWHGGSGAANSQPKPRTDIHFTNVDKILPRMKAKTCGYDTVWHFRIFKQELPD